MNLNNLLGNIGIKSNLAGDVSCLILFLVVSVAVSFLLGKHRILVSLFGIYISYAVVNLSSFDFLEDPKTKALVFLAILIGLIVFFPKIVRGSISGHGPYFYVKMAIGTAIIIGFSLSIILNWYPAKELADIVTPNVRTYFVGDFYKFLWTIAPLVYLGVVRRRID